METKSREKYLFALFIGAQAVCYAGLFLFYLAARFFGEPDPGSGPHIVVCVLGITYVISLVGLVVIALRHCRKERLHNPPQKMTLADVAGLPFGTFNPNAELPKWVAIPVKFAAWLIIGFFILCLAAVIVGVAVSYFFKDPA